MQAGAKSQKIKKSTSTKVFYVICYTFVALMALVCLLPFIMVVSGSFSSEQAIRFQGYGILPREFTTAAYALIFKSPMTVVRAYGVSIFITLAGTAVGLLLILPYARAAAARALEHVVDLFAQPALRQGYVNRLLQAQQASRPSFS